MQIEELAEIVEEMAEQHVYPGFDLRSLRLGLPESVNRASARLFVNALTHQNVLVRLTALRWFWERPGDAGRYVTQISSTLDDADEWVRKEAARTLGRIDNVPVPIVNQLAERLFDQSVQVRKAAAKSCGKLNCNNDVIISALTKAAADQDAEVRWKAQKALRKLGAYST